MSTSSCLIPANEDFAGGGVRAAVYMQALFTLTPFAFVDYSKLGTADLALLKQFCERGSGTLVISVSTSTALLLAALVGRLRRELSPHHALVALNLTWIVLISWCCRAAALFYVQEHGIPGSTIPTCHHSVRDCIRNRHLPKGQESAPVTASGDGVLFRRFSRRVSFHAWQLVITGVLGWLLFSDVEGFARPAGCPHDTVLWMFSTFVHITHPAPRLFWKIIYMTALCAPISLPILCFLVYFSFNLTFALIHEMHKKVSRRLRPRRGRAADAVGKPSSSSVMALRAFEILSVVLIILLIVSTEETIAKNPVEQDRAFWGFGQTLALILAAFALYESGALLKMGLKLRGTSTSRSQVDQSAMLP